MAGRRRQALLLFGLAAALLPLAAQGDGLTLYIEPDYTHVVQQSTNSLTGQTTSTTADALQHQYRLYLDRSLAPLLRFYASGFFQQNLVWSQTNGVWQDSDAWQSNGFVRLSAGNAFLNGDVWYQRTDQTMEGSLASFGSHDVSQLLTARIGWNPLELPQFNLQYTWRNDYDLDRVSTNRIENTVILSAIYTSLRQLRASDFATFDDTRDLLADSDVRTLLNTLQATYQDAFNGGRTTVLASVTSSSRFLDVTSTGSGGTVTILQSPMAGLAAVEIFPATPELITLAQNPALIDGNLASSAGINLGYSISQGGDNNPRDMGVQFLDPSTAVNHVYVFADRVVPPEVAIQFTWTAWQSDDNLNWKPVALAGPVQFGPFENRFDVPIQETRARYIKVVTKPLSAGTTTDRRFADIFVTELQPALVQPASSLAGTRAIFAQNASAAVHHQFLDTPQLAYDFSGTGSLSGGAGTFTLVNALTLRQPLGRVFDVNARFARQDLGTWGPAGLLHLGQYQYSASLGARPIPAVSAGLTYSGQYGQTPQGTEDLNNLNLVARAEFYKGVNAYASLGYVYNLLERGIRAWGPNVNANLSLVPNPWFNLSGTYYYSSQTQSGPTGDSVLQQQRFDANAVFTPVPAIYIGAGVTRILGVTGETLGSFTGTFTPFPTGEVVMRVSYFQSLDTLNAAKASQGIASLRWNFTTMAWTELTYSLLRSTATLGTSDTSAFVASLVITL